MAAKFTFDFFAFLIPTNKTNNCDLTFSKKKTLFILNKTKKCLRYNKIFNLHKC